MECAYHQIIQRIIFLPCCRYSNYHVFYFLVEEHRVYLLGNPIIWWGNIVLMAAFIFTLMLYYFRSQRGYVVS